MIELTKSHPNFLALQYVARARSLDGTGPAFQYVKVEDCGELAVATDRKQLHEAKLPVPMAPGLYSVRKETKTMLWMLAETPELQYPNWRQVRCDEMDGRLPGLYSLFSKGPASSRLFCRILKELPHDTAFDFARFERALPPAPTMLQVSQKRGDSPLILQTTDGMFRSVLMPCKPL